MTQIISAETANHFKRIASLATVIWTDHYTPIIGKAQVNYMLDKFQSEKAIQEQINEGSHYYLLSHNGKDAGYFSFYQKDDSLFLSKLYVLKSARGHGIGKKGLQFMESKAQESNVKSITLTVNKYNTNSIKAYEKMGFKNIKSIVQDIGNGYVMDDYVLEKTI